MGADYAESFRAESTCFWIDFAQNVRSCQTIVVSLHRKRVKTKMNGDQTERLSQEGECREVGECDILEAASEVARGVLEEIEALAGTTACKAVQLVRLRKWAEEQG